MLMKGTQHALRLMTESALPIYADFELDEWELPSTILLNAAELQVSDLPLKGKGKDDRTLIEHIVRAAAAAKKFFFCCFDEIQVLYKEEKCQLGQDIVRELLCLGKASGVATIITGSSVNVKYLAFHHTKMLDPAVDLGGYANLNHTVYGSRTIHPLRTPEELSSCYPSCDISDLFLRTGGINIGRNAASKDFQGSERDANIVGFMSDIALVALFAHFLGVNKLIQHGRVDEERVNAIIEVGSMVSLAVARKSCH